MKRFLAIYSILLYTCSCAGMEEETERIFISAAIQGHVEKLQAILDQHNIRNDLLYFAYDLAIKNGYIQVLRLLRRYRVELFAERIIQEDTPERMLYHALREERLEDAQQILASGSGPHISQASLDGELYDAIGNATTVRWLIENVKYTPEKLDKVLWFAIDRGHDELAQYTKALLKEMRQ